MCQNRQLTKDGIELTWAVNHLAPFLLSKLLLHRLKESLAESTAPRSSIFPLDILLDGPSHLDQTTPNLLKERDHLVDLGIARQLELRLDRLCA
jgi:NAD(P)-dependent dehydrogenase (short-subunit alcohol dehydrogenase family)